MGSFIQFVGPKHSLQIFGVRMVGLNLESGKKLLFSIIFLFAVWLFGRVLKWATKPMKQANEHRAFWIRQGISITVAVVNVVGLISIWFDDPTRLATALGLVTAGLAFALQQV